MKPTVRTFSPNFEFVYIREVYTFVNCVAAAKAICKCVTKKLAPIAGIHFTTPCKLYIFLALLLAYVSV